MSTPTVPSIQTYLGNPVGQALSAQKNIKSCVESCKEFFQAVDFCEKEYLKPNDKGLKDIEIKIDKPVWYGGKASLLVAILESELDGLCERNGTKMALDGYVKQGAKLEDLEPKVIENILSMDQPAYHLYTQVIATAKELNNQLKEINGGETAMTGFLESKGIGRAI